MKKEIKKGYLEEKYLLQTNPMQTMIDSETARELIWEWNESVHKYVIKEEEEPENKKEIP